MAPTPLPPVPPLPPSPPLPPTPWLPINVLWLIVRVEPALLIAPPGPPRPLPPAAPAPPAPPVPPSAWLARNVQYSTVMVEEACPTKLKNAFSRAPATPKPPSPPFWPGPPSAPLPPRARLPSKVLCNTVAWLPPALLTAPPTALPWKKTGPAPRLVVGWLPVKVLWSSTMTDPPSLTMAPADPNMAPAARFSVKVLSVTTRVAPEKLAMAPPCALGPTAWLFVMVTWVRMTRATVFSRPLPRVTGPRGPSTVVPVAAPLAMVRSRISTSVAPPLTLKTRLASLPLMDKRWAPGPSRVRSSVMLSSPLVSVMVPSRAAGAKRIRSAPGLSLASRIACRSDSGPLSARLRTVKVLGTVRSASHSTLKRAALARLRRRAGGCPFSAPDGPTRERADRSQDDIGIAKTPWEDWSAIQGKQHRCRRADRAPGRCRVGEGLAWR